jgi:Cu/Zn superoxide dismutase
VSQHPQKKENHADDTFGLVVHAGADLGTQPSGDAGGRVALGVIGVAQETSDG